LFKAVSWNSGEVQLICGCWRVPKLLCSFPLLLACFNINQSTFSTVSGVSGAQFNTYTADIVKVLNLHLKPGIFTIIWNILKETQDHSNKNCYYY